MADAKREERSPSQVSVDSGYPRFQLSKALAACAAALDAQFSERAHKKARSWQQVIKNLVREDVDYGSRTPVRATPAWVTLEVVKGGFATGAMMAAGPLLEHELSMLRRIGPVASGDERAALNAYFLSEEGLKELQALLRSGRYRIAVPEEGALMVVAWWAGEGHGDRAQELLRRIAPFFPQLRFYPEPSTQPSTGPLLHVRDTEAAVQQLRARRPHYGVQAQKEATEVWGPYQDRMAALFMETLRDGWPCQVYPAGWVDRARALLDEFVQLRRVHRLCGNPENPKKHFAQLRGFLERATEAPQSLSGRDVARIRSILNSQVLKRGAPGSARSTRYRAAQANDVAAPMHHRLANVLATRASAYQGGLTAAEIDSLLGKTTWGEASLHGLPEGVPMPQSLDWKLRRCLAGTAEELVEQGIISSGEVLACALPQVTSSIRAESLGNEQLCRLYAGVYRAFRQRRSLLLLNLEKQVQLEELPWIAAIEELRLHTAGDQDVSREALVRIATTALKAWPYAILPNKLLRELVALAQVAGIEVPLVEELAADIFMGRFSPKFVKSTLLSATLLEGSLYARYYAVEYGAVTEQLSSLPGSDADGNAATQRFAEICRIRTALAAPRWSPASNGMLIEQQQILTTQNLAAVFSIPGARSTLEPELFAMAQTCLRWVCRRQQMKIMDHHARLLMLKNTAYAWRQMIFFLSLQPAARVREYLVWAEEHIQQQPESFRLRFEPAMSGLAMAAVGHSPPREPTETSTARQFLGWSDRRHWLMPA